MYTRYGLGYRLILMRHYTAIDASAGDDLGANTDGFDIGDSDTVYIEYATVYNQDDCVAINSGTVRDIP